MNSKVWFAVFCLFLSGLWPRVLEAGSVEIVYVANAGFLLSSHSQKVLIDALFDDGLGRYSTPPRGTRKKMKASRPPFDHVDVILVTHRHRDHFDENMVIDHLKSNRAGALVAPQQVVNLLKKHKKFHEVSGQIMEVTPEPGSVIRQTVNGVELGVLGMKHVPSPGNGGDAHAGVQNVGFVVSLGGVNILHGGDAVLDLDTAFIDSTGIAREKIDVLFIKHFDRSESTVRIVTEKICPSHIVCMQVPPKEMEQISKVFRASYPNACFFEEPMDGKVFRVDG